MITQRKIQRRKRPLSLSVRVSGLLAFAAIVPLIITVATIELVSRPTLIAQASQAMEMDAQTHAQSIDSYFSERILETEALSRLQPIQQFLAGDETLKSRALDGLATGHGRGSYYQDWSLLDTQGHLSLYYPTRPQTHGQYYIPPEDLQQLQSSSAEVNSDVFFSPASNEAYMDIYVPVRLSSTFLNITTPGRLVGFLRASFDLHYIWQLVNSEAGAGGADSYAGILDQNGVFIAYTNPNPDAFSMTDSPQLFTAIAPLSAAIQQRINSEGLYGKSLHTPVSIQSDTTLAAIQQSKNPPATFQLTPAEQQQTFQVARSRTYTVPWTYLVLRPLSTTTLVADQQLLVTSIITFAILVLAALIGLGVGQRIAQPILRSVEYLLTSSEKLKTLAAREQSAAQEQTWVVDSSQVGLRQVDYYINAANVAAARLREIASTSLENWQHLDEYKRKQSLREIITTAEYIEHAAKCQQDSSKSLATAINVTTQVTEQLATGATETNDAAAQLEQVVNRLRQVAGK